METSFGCLTLSIFSLIDGKVLSNALTNREDKMLGFIHAMYRVCLANYLDNQDEQSKRFLDLCNQNVSNIIDDNWSFIDSYTNNDSRALDSFFRQKSRG